MPPRSEVITYMILYPIVIIETTHISNTTENVDSREWFSFQEQVNGVNEAPMSHGFVEHSQHSQLPANLSEPQRAFLTTTAESRYLLLEELNMSDSNPLVGTWKLVSWEVTQLDGTIHYPYGKDVVGYLIYTADGYMAAEIMDPDRQQSDPSFRLEIAAAQTLSDPDRARAYSTYVSYCGTYTVEGNTLTHHVKAGLIPSWTGSE